MFSVAEAEQLIFTLVEPIAAATETETIDLDAAIASLDQVLGRVLAQPVTSALDFPHWDNSAMDGYAVRASDVSQVPVTLAVIEEIPAGQKPNQTIAPGQAARILTGAMMPDGADTVVMQENTQRQGTSVTVLQSAEPQSFVRQRGSFSQAGDVLLAAGSAIGPAELALLAAAQQTKITVYRRPRVAILSTGSELVRPDQPLQAGQIVDSNQYALAALVSQTGAQALPLGIVQDNRAAVRAAIAEAVAQADLVISTGGVSVGDYDYIDDVLAELGAKLHIRSVAVKPGKPLTVASYSTRRPKAYDSAQPTGPGSTQQAGGKTLYFGLPGNPASAMVGFWRFVAPAIAKLSGRAGPWGPTFVWAIAQTDLRAGGGRETYLWGQLTVAESGGYCFGRAAGSHSSGNLVNLVNTSGLGIVPQGETLIKAGEPVRVLKIR